MSPTSGASGVRFGVLGAAKVAEKALLRPAEALDNVEVVTIAARDRDRAERFAAAHAVPSVEDAYQDVLDRPDVDAVYIPLPNGLHGTWTTRAVQAGKHVLCEKPFAANAEEAAAVAAVASSSDRVVMEALHWRYHPMAHRIVELVSGDELGTLRSVEATVCFPIVDPRNIRWQLGLAGGAALDMGCYAVHMARTVALAAGCDEPEVVSAKAKDGWGGVDRTLAGRLRFPHPEGVSVEGTVTCSMLTARFMQLRLEARGDRGMVRATNPLSPHRAGRLSWSTGTDRHTERPSKTPTYSYQLRVFADAVLHGGPVLTGPTEAVNTMAVLDALLRAAGLEVRQPLQVQGTA